MTRRRFSHMALLPRTEGDPLVAPAEQVHHLVDVRSAGGVAMHRIPWVSRTIARKSVVVGAIDRGRADRTVVGSRVMNRRFLYEAQPFVVPLLDIFWRRHDLQRLQL